MKKYKNYQIMLLTFFCIFLNFIGRFIAEKFYLPLWLDSFGTFLMAYALGPFCGAIVGASNNIIYGFINPVALAYSITSICIALVVGYFAKYGWMKNLFKTMSLSVMVTGVCVIISCILNQIFFNGMTNNRWGDGIIEMLQSWGLVHPLCVVMGEFYVDFVDKVITLGALFFFIRFYRLIKSYLPEFLVLQVSADSEKQQVPTEPVDLKSFKTIIGLLFAAALFTAAPQKAYATTKKFNAYIKTVYNNANGLPGGEANDIASSSDGILWIGTYAGLYRHNGKEFRLMNEYDSIKAVRCLYVDADGRLIVGTNDNGFSIVINEEITNVVTEKNGLPSDSVRCITSASDGLYYVGTSDALAVIEINDGIRIKKIISEINSAVRVAPDNRGNVAAVSSNGKLYILKDAKISSVISEESVKFISAAFAEDGRLYVAGENNLVYVFDIMEQNNKLVQKISCGSMKHINSLVFSEDVLFLCSDSGAGYVDYNDRCEFHNIETGIFNNSIDNMIEDYQGNLWFSSSRLGLLKMCESAFSEIYLNAGYSEAVVNAIIKYNGKIYFGTDNGLSMIDEVTGLAEENELTKKLAGLRIRCLMIDSKDRMWVCSYTKGLYCMDERGRISEYETTTGQQFRVLKELKDGTIVAAGKKGITFLKNGQLESRITSKDGLDNPVVLSLSQLADGTLVAGTDGGGLAIIKNQKVEKLIKKQDGLTSDVILRTVIDYDKGQPTGGLYLITSNSLCYMNSDFSIKYLSNFPYSNNYDLVSTKDNNLFVLGSAGIFVVNRDELFSGQKLDYILLDLKKGLLGSLTANSWNYVDENNNLYLCCDTGASCVNLDSYDKNNRSYRMQLKSVIVNGKRHIIQKDIPFVIPAGSDSIEVVPEILNYSINNPFISLFMEGIDEHPNIMTQNELASVIYTNISAGTYQFHISMLDSRGRNVIEECIYTIEKPFRLYDNWWFKFYAFFVMIMAITWLTWYITATIQNRRFEKQERELSFVRDQIRMGNETILSIANAVEARDKRTGRHSFRVAVYSMLMAVELGFNDEELENIRQIGLLHDIGKIGVPDSILNKRGKLTAEEYEIMKKHVDIGGEILKDFSYIKNVADGAKYHHERYDGKGYNAGLKGEEIPLTARIIGIADAFDAMTSNRVYRKAMKMEDVIVELKAGKGTQFDPALVDIMLELISSGRIDVSEINKQSAEVEE
ncbi:MAG: HD domain-containing protein [Treponema sp.]|nr:HD domain-containing protein [Treponema sp.]